jgi:hypothetical protein
MGKEGVPSPAVRATRIEPFTSIVNSGFVVPIPTLPPETEIGELPTVEGVLVEVNTGTVPEVPEPVTCAAALIANAAMQIATAAIFLCIVLIPFLNRTASGKTRLPTAPEALGAYGVFDRCC